MPTNDERREVAARLRVLAQASYRSGDDKVYATICRILLGWRADMLDTVDAHFALALLADLIEPEERTCRDDGVGVFRCTRCGAFVKRGAVMDCTGTIPLRFCPNCGAKVVKR